MKRTASSARTLARFALIGLVGVSFAGIVAFKNMFPHSGEEALDLVPMTALAAGTLDLDPAPSQVLAFKKIDEALKRNGFADSLKGILEKAADGFSEQKELWALSKHSISACILKSPDQTIEPVDTGGALLVPVNDGNAAEQMLKTHGIPEFWKGTHFYHLLHSPVCALVERETLVLSNEPWTLHEIAKVATAELPPITTSDGFSQARGKEPSDATLLVMISPLAEEAIRQHISTHLLGWASLSLTVKDGGLALSGHGRLDRRLPGGALEGLPSVSPLRQDLLNVLPSGAFGFFALSQPSVSLATLASGDKDSKVTRQILEVKEQVFKASGLDFDNDILPGLKGDMMVAAYPSEEPATGLELLLVADNQNGAEPAVLAEKLQTFVDRQMSSCQSLGKDWAVPLPRPDGTELRLSPTIEKKMQDSLKADKSGVLRMNVLASDKTLAWASVSGTVFVATSQKLLDNATSAYQGKASSLVSDQGLISRVQLEPDHQTLVVIDFARIAEGVRKGTDRSKMSPENAARLDQVLGVVDHLTAPLSVQFSYFKDGSTAGSAFMPLDYDKIIDLAGSLTKPTQGASMIRA